MAQMSRWRFTCGCPLGAIYREERRVKKVLLWPSHAKGCRLFSSGARKRKRGRKFRLYSRRLKCCAYKGVGRRKVIHRRLLNSLHRVCWLLSPTFDSPFSTSEHLYFLPSPSLPNPTLWISVGVWATENTLGTENCVDLSLSSWDPFFSSCSSLSPSSLSSSSCNSVNLSGCPSWWRIFLPLT